MSRPTLDEAPADFGGFPDHDDQADDDDNAAVGEE